MIIFKRHSGKIFCKGKMLHELFLNDKPFRAMKDGVKNIEMRLNDEQKSKIKVGDKIEFTNNSTKERVTVDVTALYHYRDFYELYQHFPKTRLGYKPEETANPDDMFEYYTKERIEKYGALGIEIANFSFH